MPADPWFDAQKLLYSLKLRDWILNQEVSIYHQELFSWKRFQPAMHKSVVHGNGQWTISRVDGSIGKGGELLEGLASGAERGLEARIGSGLRMRAELRVVGYRPGDGLANY